MMPESSDTCTKRSAFTEKLARAESHILEFTCISPVLRRVGETGLELGYGLFTNIMWVKSGLRVRYLGPRWKGSS